MKLFTILKTIFYIFRMIPPMILRVLTGKDRYLPPIKWTNSITYDLFRVWELIFWREYGIRPESSAKCVRINGKDYVSYKFYSLEAFVVHCEYFIRSWIKGLIPKGLEIKVYIPQLASANGLPSLVRFPGIFFSIAFDTSVSGGSTGTTSLTWSHTVTGTNPIIFEHTGDFQNSGSVDTVSGVTYNGNSATKVDNVQNPGQAGYWLGLYYNAAPATGAHNCVMSLSSNVLVAYGASASFSGAKQSTPIDVHGTAQVSGTDASKSLTASTSTGWGVASAFFSSGTISDSTNFKVRQSPAGNSVIGDSNGALASGSNTITAHNSTSTDGAIAAAIFLIGGTAYTSTFNDTVTVSETFAKLVGAVKSETITLSETFAKAISKVVSETITLTEPSFNAARTVLKTISESDTIISDTIAKLVSKVRSDTATLSESFSTLYIKVLEFTETAITITDTMARGFFKAFSETLTLTEQFNKLKNGVNTVWTKVANNIGTWIKSGRNN